MRLSELATVAVLTILVAGPGRAAPGEVAPGEGGTAATRALAEADAVFGKGKYAEARPLYERAAETARAAGDRSTETEALAQVARMCSLTERLEEGKVWLEKARAVASPEQPLGWTRYLGVRGIFEREAGEKAKALATFVEMYRYAMEKKIPRRAIDAAHHAAVVAPPEEQIAWARKGIAAAEAAKDEIWLAVLWNNLGATCDWDLKDYPKAIECYEKARDYHYRTGGDQQKLAADWALGKACLSAGRVEKAEPLLVAARKQARARHEAEPTKETTEWVGYTERWCGELLVAKGRREEGLKSLRAGRQALVEAGIETWWPEGLKELDERIAKLAEGE